MFHLKPESQKQIKHSEVHLRRVKDHLVSGEEFSLVHNKQFNALATAPKPSLVEIAGYYESDEYLSHSDQHRSFFSRIYALVRGVNLRTKKKWVEDHVNAPGRLLDVGTGVGHFLDVMRAGRWNVQGIEVGDRPRAIAQAKGHVVHAQWAGVLGEKYDAVTLWHVLEHLDDLESRIADLGSLVDENGFLIVAVPNYRSFDARHYKAFWAGYDVPRHLWHFEQASMHHLFVDQFDLIDKKFMWFDSFYVSYLSHYYKTNNKRSVTPFFVALWSNLRTLWDGECSSIAYIYQKKP